MSSTELASIETRIAQLSRNDQLLLIERLAHRLRDSSRESEASRERDLAAMAADPEIQRELAAIREEFAVTEGDGLENL